MMQRKYKMQPDWKNIPGPESIAHFTLPNGMRLLIYSNFNSPSAYMLGALESGSVADPADKLGLANFTTAMLSRGTEKHAFSDFHRQLETRGASLNFSCGARHTTFRGQSLVEDLEMLFELASEALLQPAFAPDYVERTRKQLLAGLAIREQDTEEIASLLFDEALFPAHPYGQPTDGFTHTVQAITREDLVRFHRSQFQPQGMLMAVCGAVQPGQVQQLAERFFSAWCNPQAQRTQPPAVPPAPAGIIRRHRFIPEKSQQDLVMGTLGPARLSDDFVPAYVGNNILGQFGLMGRIGASVRVKAGLAYFASSSLTAWQECGSWEFSAGLDPANSEKAIALIRKEIRRFITKPVTNGELSDTQSHLIGRLPLSLESNAGLANALINIERFGLGLDYYQNYPAMIRAVSAEQILQAARAYLHPDRLVIASAGPGEDIL